MILPEPPFGVIWEVSAYERCPLAEVGLYFNCRDKEEFPTQDQTNN